MDARRGARAVGSTSRLLFLGRSPRRGLRDGVYDFVARHRRSSSRSEPGDGRFVALGHPTAAAQSEVKRLAAIGVED